MRLCLPLSFKATNSNKRKLVVHSSCSHFRVIFYHQIDTRVAKGSFYIKESKLEKLRKQRNIFGKKTIEYSNQKFGFEFRGNLQPRKFAWS